MKTKTSVRFSDAALENLASITSATGSNQTAAVENALAVYSAFLRMYGEVGIRGFLEVLRKFAEERDAKG